MTDRNQQSGSGDPAREETIDRLLRDALQQGTDAPDLTKPIMGRLGFMRAAPRVAARRRTRRWMTRSSLSALALALVILGVKLQEQAAEITHPAHATVPAAISSDLNRAQDRVERTIRTIRSLSPAPLQSRPERPTEIDRDTFRNSEPGRLIDDDVDRSAVGPVRWI